MSYRPIANYTLFSSMVEQTRSTTTCFPNQNIVFLSTKPNNFSSSFHKPSSISMSWILSIEISRLKIYWSTAIASLNWLISGSVSDAKDLKLLTPSVELRPIWHLKLCQKLTTALFTPICGRLVSFSMSCYKATTLSEPRMRTISSKKLRKGTSNTFTTIFRSRVSVWLRTFWRSIL